MQMRKSTLKKRQKLKRWRVDEAERYMEAAPDGRNNSKGSYTTVVRLCTKQRGVVAESAKRQQGIKGMR